LDPQVPASLGALGGPLGRIMPKKKPAFMTGRILKSRKEFIEDAKAFKEWEAANRPKTKAEAEEQKAMLNSLKAKAQIRAQKREKKPRPQPIKKKKDIL